MKNFVQANILAVSPGLGHSTSGSRQRHQSRLPRSVSQSTPRPGVQQSLGRQPRHLSPYTPRITVSSSTSSAGHDPVETERNRRDLDQVKNDNSELKNNLENSTKENDKKVKKIKKKVEKLEGENNQLKVKVQKFENEKDELRLKVQKLEDRNKEMEVKLQTFERLFSTMLSSSQSEASNRSSESGVTAKAGPGTCGGCHKHFVRLDLHKRRTRNQLCKIST